MCSYSKCGKYIGAGGENGEITIWDIEANKIIREMEKSTETEAQCITAIDWSPKHNGEFAYTDKTGQFGLVENIFGSDDNILDRDNEIEELNDDINFGDSEYSILFYSENRNV